MPSTDVERLRDALERAGALAQSMGDEPRPEPAGVGYFADDSTSGIEHAIETIASHGGEITMFVGAGVSMEAELPSWQGLVRRLLVAANSKHEPWLIDKWADTVLAEGPLSAASVAEALYGEDGAAFRRALRDALYTRPASSYAPGALADQIAWLKQRLGSRLALLTVNYDGLLEAALLERKLETVSYVRGQSEPKERAAVWHLHGRLVRDATDRRWQREGRLVLTEGSYVHSTRRPFPQKFVARRLRCSLCVFVGLSMTDPNFIRWLYNSAEESGGPRFVIFVRQASPVADLRVQRVLEQSAVARWARYGVTPVWANYYGEVAQIVHEIGLRCAGGKPTPFSTRAQQRFACCSQRLAPSSTSRFARHQTAASTWLRSLLAGVHRICTLADPPIDLSEHRLGLALWAVDHEHGQIVNLASSDRAYQEPEALVPIPLHVHSRWVAAAAVASGVAVEQDPKVYASRWRFIRAIPVVVEADGERSVVGALTLTSTTALHDFPLAKHLAPPGLLSGIDELLTKSAGALFVD
jgi:hypothetical protein